MSRAGRFRPALRRLPVAVMVAAGAAAVAAPPAAADAPFTPPPAVPATPPAGAATAVTPAAQKTEPFDDRCMSGLAAADRQLIRATRARLRRSAPGEAPAALFHNSARWGCARIRFRIDAAGMTQELKIDHAWPDWTYARAAWRLVQELRFLPSQAAAGEAALIVINLAGGDTSD
ncbi:hypothetical protein [Tahibacter harae]|uniref:TonB family protein n=1 Tax=Tahibacter harae TaxID=2963937 RepID=A0ABT1QXN5_9GAMM|nr:hypothetical protein [Tahibacter harae]MCQ4167046.1 hypothetical protein [Tahibacter harae]